MEIVKIPPTTPPRPTVCFARPSILGQPNPMVYCVHPLGHEGPHSWER